MDKDSASSMSVVELTPAPSKAISGAAEGDFFAQVRHCGKELFIYHYDHRENIELAAIVTVLFVVVLALLNSSVAKEMRRNFFVLNAAAFVLVVPQVIYQVLVFMLGVTDIPQACLIFN